MVRWKTVKIPASLHKRIKAFCRRNKILMQDYIRSSLEEQLFLDMQCEKEGEDGWKRRKKLQAMSQ